MEAAIGLLGGSFDPVHFGHLQLGRDALRELQLEVVRFLPAAQPWQKASMTDAAHRAKMVQLAIADEPDFVLDAHEIERGGPTYTIDTLRELRAAVGKQTPLVWIMGADQFERFDTWRDWQLIPALAHIALAQRAGRAPRPNPSLEPLLQRRRPAAALRTAPAGALVEFDMTPVDISATEVRRLLGQQLTPEVDARLESAVPKPVLDYIRDHHLYR